MSEVVDKFYNFKFDHYGAKIKGTHDETEFIIFRARKHLEESMIIILKAYGNGKLREVAKPIYMII